MYLYMHKLCLETFYNISHLPMELWNVLKLHNVCMYWEGVCQ